MHNTTMPEVGSQAKRAAMSCLWSSICMKNFKHKPSDKSQNRTGCSALDVQAWLQTSMTWFWSLKDWDKQWKEMNFQTRIFVTAFKSSYSISYLRNCTPAWLFKLLSMQQLTFRFTGGGKNYMFWKVRLWVSSWDIQETKHCVNVLIVASRPSF